jgi:hypothetical protein
MNNIINAVRIWVISIVAFSIFGACNDDDAALPDNLVAVETPDLGFEGNETAIKIKFTRALSEDAEIGITLTANYLTYGTQFTTNPDGSSGTISLTVPEGSTEAAFSVIRVPDAFLNGDESITFVIASATEPVLLGETLTTELSFGAITSEGSQLQLSGKTDISHYANSVFADLSANKQTAVDRKGWNLGFYGGSDFRVVLNHAYQTAAAPTTKTDINAVTLADADAVAASAYNLNFAPGAGSLDVVDSWDGDLNNTAFVPVSSNESENPVYLVSFEGSKEKDKWLKVKVNRNGDGYRVLYAVVGETTIKTIDVTKNPEYNFTFVSLETNNIVTVEPVKQSWDIGWTYSTYDAGNTPYWYQDFIVLNHVGGAEAAQVIKPSATEAEAAFISFAEADLAGISFANTRDVIGRNWRDTGGPGAPATGIKRDRFYVIKDPRGNIYKLKFVSMGLGGDGGERGKPVIEYKLVRKAG